MALALNICRNRVCKAEEIDSNCGLNTKTVGQSFSAADGIFANPVRDSNSCNVGACLGREINNGRALKLNSLNLSIQGGSVKLIWAPSRLDDGTVTPSGYTIWRRPAGSTQEFKLVGKSVLPMYVDRNAKSLTAFEYRVVPVAP